MNDGAKLLLFVLHVPGGSQELVERTVSRVVKQLMRPPDPGLQTDVIFSVARTDSELLTQVEEPLTLAVQRARNKARTEQVNAEMRIICPPLERNSFDYSLLFARREWKSLGVGSHAPIRVVIHQIDEILAKIQGVLYAEREKRF